MTDEKTSSTPPKKTPDSQLENLKQVGLICPNCGSALENQKCKLFCRRPGCGYMVTCSEW